MKTNNGIKNSPREKTRRTWTKKKKEPQRTDWLQSWLDSAEETIDEVEHRSEDLSWVLAEVEVQSGVTAEKQEYCFPEPVKHVREHGEPELDDKNS